MDVTTAEFRKNEIARLARELISIANDYGIVVTIEQKPKLPLMMGNYESVVSVRECRK